MSTPLLPPRFLFRFGFTCPYRKPLWKKSGLALPDECRLPKLAELEGSRNYAEVRCTFEALI